MATTPPISRFTFLAVALTLLLSSPACFSADRWYKTPDIILKPGRAGVGSGTEVAYSIFQNRSTTSCAMGGFPTLTALDKNEKPIKRVEFNRVPQVHCASERRPVPARMILEPGQDAWFQLVLRNGTGVEDESCARTLQAFTSRRQEIAYP